VIRNLSDLASFLPPGWDEVPICIASVASAPREIKRISLQENTDGSRVVLIHDDEISAPNFLCQRCRLLDCTCEMTGDQQK